jgi:hypothetical protein
MLQTFGPLTELLSFARFHQRVGLFLYPWRVERSMSAPECMAMNCALNLIKHRIRNLEWTAGSLDKGSTPPTAVKL